MDRVDDTLYRPASNLQRCRETNNDWGGTHDHKSLPIEPGAFSVLNSPDALRVETRPSGGRVAIDPKAFREAFARFQQLMVAKSGHRFTNFHEGLAAVWESYKPRLRDRALELLASDGWSEAGIGSGAILQHTVDAIEIQDNRGNLINNLVFWQNRFGHANRDHRALMEAASNLKVRRDLEQLIFGLYRGNADEADTFDRLTEPRRSGGCARLRPDESADAGVPQIGRRGGGLVDTWAYGHAQNFPVLAFGHAGGGGKTMAECPAVAIAAGRDWSCRP